jgi:hypothetical protein
MTRPEGSAFRSEGGGPPRSPAGIWTIVEASAILSGNLLGT